jgi:hypothetical protein
MTRASTRALFAIAVIAAPAFGAGPKLTTSVIDPVWSGHRVNFALQTSDDAVYVAYYDAERQLTVASRPRESRQWTFQKLDEHTGWDSHNYLAMAIDSAGHVHVTGNMHNDPLVYFRTKVPRDIHTLERVPMLVDARLEQRMTYPVFVPVSPGRLILKYRDGGSGNGNEIYAVYDVATERWSHLLTTPLVDGEGQRNAYFVGPTLGSDGFYHLAWVWRETPDAETNHDLSYARTRDFVHWEKSDGAPLKLPITLASAEIVDPVPVAAGMINNNTVVGFDNLGRAMITYHKFDARGDTQIYLARREDHRWHSVAITKWRGFRWDFRGRGSLDSRLFVNGAVRDSAKHSRVRVIRDGRAIDIVVDARTLARVRETAAQTLEDELRSNVTVPAGMRLNTVEHADGVAIAWATRPPNRDQPTTDIPAATPLLLVERAVNGR